VAYRLFVFPTPIHFACSKSGATGREERQAEWFRHDADHAGVRLFRQNKGISI
jgi:hypothetical protein